MHGQVQVNQRYQPPASGRVEVMSGTALRVLGIPSVMGLGSLRLGDAGDSAIVEFSAVQIAGAALGGSIVGYLASSDVRGASTGALGVGGSSTAVIGYTLLRAGRTVAGALTMLGGAAAMSAAIWMAMKRR